MTSLASDLKVNSNFIHEDGVAPQTWACTSEQCRAYMHPNLQKFVVTPTLSPEGPDAAF